MEGLKKKMVKKDGEKPCSIEKKKVIYLKREIRISILKNFN